MRNPAELFTLSEAAAQVPAGLPLLAALTGFIDAGSTAAQFGAKLAAAPDSVVVAEFDADLLLDYRARRPIILFDQDHIAEFTAATLTLRLARDEAGSPYLLLSGFEPDFHWEGFIAAVVQLIGHFGVSATSWVQAIPTPTPHTRPLGVTVSGSRTDLIDQFSIWRPQTQAPANALHLLEYRLQQAGRPVTGFVLLVPHYLADTEYPAALVTALECVSAATGLIFATDAVREANREFVQRVDEQVLSNDELSSLVQALEQRHDQYLESNPLPSPFTGEDGQLPSADSIAAELEKFLATQRRRDEE